MKHQVKLADYFRRLSELLLSMEATNGTGQAMSLEKGADVALDLILQVRNNSGKVMLVGNGGSATIVSHFQNDLSENAGVRAMVFTEPPAMTARSNDHGYGSVFERPVQLWGEPGDLLLAVSSSGSSENIIRAVKAARTKQCRVITFTGFSPTNPARRLGDLNFYVGSDVYGYVESAHTAIAHYLSTGLPTAT